METEIVQFKPNSLSEEMIIIGSVTYLLPMEPLVRLLVCRLVCLLKSLERHFFVFM